MSISPGIKSSLLKQFILRNLLQTEPRSHSSLPLSNPTKTPQIKEQHLFFLDDLNVAPAGTIAGKLEL